MLWEYKASVVERTGKADITLSFATSCSALWIFYLPSVVENLTGRTSRFTHLCASLRFFKDGSLGIPGLLHSSIDIT